MDKIYLCPVNCILLLTTLYGTLENNGYDLKRILVFSLKIYL